jgi:hypothetical protein
VTGFTKDDIASDKNVSPTTEETTMSCRPREKQLWILLEAGKRTTLRCVIELIEVLCRVVPTAAISATLNNEKDKENKNNCEDNKKRVCGSILHSTYDRIFAG